MRRRPEQIGWRESVRGYAWASPWFIGFLFLTVGPMIFAAVISLTDWSGVGSIGEAEWVGVENYVRPFADTAHHGRDEYFAMALRNTAIYAVGSVVLTLAAALGLAMLLHQKLRGIAIYRTVFFMPAIVSGVATMVMWRWVYNPEFGLLNAGLRLVYRGWNAVAPAALHLTATPDWIYSVHWALPALILMSVWGCGGAMMIFLAGLQNIPEHLYEAASIDGAGWWRRFVHITLPQLSPTIFFNLVMGIIGSFQVFAQAYLLPATPGGPSNATLVYVLYLYRKAFMETEMGYACALGWILFAVILAVTLAVVGTSRRWVYYEGAEA